MLPLEDGSHDAGPGCIAVGCVDRQQLDVFLVTFTYEVVVRDSQPVFRDAGLCFETSWLV
jgi:hypothetical protein